MQTDLLSERQKSHLPLNESVLWCGKDHAKVWNRSVVPPMLLAIPWCAITSLSICQVLVPKWMNAISSNSVQTSQQHQLLQLIGVTIFMIPFVCVGIGFLFAPLWRWIALRKRVWVVTDKAVYRFGAFSHRSWRRMEISDKIDRVDKTDGCSDFHFARDSFASRRGHVGTMLCTIENVPQMEAMALDAAFHHLIDYSSENDSASRP